MTESELLLLWTGLGIPLNYAAERGLTPQCEADEVDLIDLGRNPSGRPVLLLRGAADAWRGMKSASSADGIELIAISGFRSVERQAEIVRAKLAAGQSMVDILRTVAAPGFSEHHTGRALDIGSPDHLTLEEDFALTPAFHWLAQNAARFGFALSFPRHNPHGIAYEPWHWCWREHA